MNQLPNQDSMPVVHTFRKRKQEDQLKVCLSYIAAIGQPTLPVTLSQSKETKEFFQLYPED